MPGWKGSNRRATLPQGWAVTTLRILNRDHHRCQHMREDTARRCLAKARDVDHIIRPADGGPENDTNLQSLCRYHHEQKTGREGGTASGRSRRAKLDAAKPLHPGLLTEPPQAEEPPPF